VSAPRTEIVIPADGPEIAEQIARLKSRDPAAAYWLTIKASLCRRTGEPLRVELDAAGEIIP
jgi:hypothetical protein